MRGEKPEKIVRVNSYPVSCKGLDMMQVCLDFCRLQPFTCINGCFQVLSSLVYIFSEVIFLNSTILNTLSIVECCTPIANCAAYCIDCVASCYKTEDHFA